MVSKLIKREVYIAIHAQSSRFRVVKWIVLILITYTLYLWRGWMTVGIWILFGIILGLAIHFLFRKKTNGWRKAWGPFKPIKTPFD